MANYLLFKQLCCLLLFFEHIVLLFNFKRYFGPLVYPESIFTTPIRICAFHFVLFASLALLFLNCFGILAGFSLLICMRYLFIEGDKTRISTFGAVGFICYFIAAVIFFFELALIIDPSERLTSFFHTILAIELGIMLFSAGFYKAMLGYLDHHGFEYALVNPSWSKFYFLFNRIRPSSWFFTLNDYGAFITELLAGCLFFIPQTQFLGAYLMMGIFTYVFALVRVNIMPVLLVCAGLLFVRPLNFHFPTFEGLSFQLKTPDIAITAFETLIIFFVALDVLFTFKRMLEFYTKIYHLNHQSLTASQLTKWELSYCNARPLPEWTVFTYGLVRFFIKIDKVSKSTNEILMTIFDGFSKNYREAFEDPPLFFRFAHHHESSFLLSLFILFGITNTETAKKYQEEQYEKMISYAKTLLNEKESNDIAISFSVIEIRDIEDRFAYVPIVSYLVDLKSEKVNVGYIEDDM